MARARELGAEVLGTTSPNPPVGAVVLAADGTVAGEGATAPPGGPHAEVRALAQAGERLRAGCDAVVVGSGTALADDPQLTVRDAGGRDAERQPLRVVVDRRGRLPENARLLDDAAPTHVSTAATPGALLDELFGRD